MLEIDYSKYVNSIKVPSLDEYELMFDPQFDPLDFSPFMNVCIRRFQSLFSYKNPDVIYFLFGNGAGVMTVTDGAPITEMEKDGETYHSDVLSCVKSIYVLPEHRNKGVQRKLLKDLLSVSVGARTPAWIFSGPFELSPEPKGDVFDAVKALISPSTRLTMIDNEKVKETQRSRFRKAGFINVPYDFAEYTTEPDQWLICPMNIESKGIIRMLELKGILQVK